MLVLVGLPYIKCKLDLFYQQVASPSNSILGDDDEQHEIENEELEDNNTKPSRKLAIRLKRLFKKVYPIINFIYHVSNLGYNIAYMFEKTRYYTPWLHLIGIEVKRMDMNDYVRPIDAFIHIQTHSYFMKRAYYEKTAKPVTQSISLKSPLKTMSAIVSKVIEYLKVLLPMSIFFFKFLEWWYSSEFSRSNTFSQGENDENTVPPPEKIKVRAHLYILLYIY